MPPLCLFDRLRIMPEFKVKSQKSKVKSLFCTLFLLFFFSFSVIPVFAATPTPTTAAAITGSPTCDLCGFCAGGVKPGNWDQCNTCLYDPSGAIIEGNYWTVAGCWSTKPELFVKSILSIVFGISGGLAFLAFIGGSIMVLTSSGDPEKLNNGKSIVVSSIFGLLLIVFSVFLLRFVGVEILKIPGFG